MIMRVFVPAAAAAAAAAVLAIAGPAAAQSNFTHPTGGWTVTLPASMGPHPMGALNAEKGQFVVNRGGAQVGICVASAVAPGDPVTPGVWTQVAAAFTDEPEARMRSAAERAGHTFISLKGSRPYKSRAGWDGYFIWYERTNGTTNTNQTAVNSGTMLSANHRFVAVCTSSKGYFFDANEINAIHSFVSSARAP